MRTVQDGDRLAQLLANSAGWGCHVTSWSGTGSLLAWSVPVSRGKVTVAASSDTIASLDLTVPRFADGIDWSPRRKPAHPLARFGQLLDVSVIVTSPYGGDWTLRVGRFQIASWSDSMTSVSVKGVGMLQLAKDSSTPAPIQPAAKETFASLARRVAPAGLHVSVDDALVDRAVPSSAVTKNDRLDALNEIAAAWPALLRLDDWGQACFTPPLPDVPKPVVWFTDGVAGTVVSAPYDDTRDGAYNVVRATSSAQGAENIYAEARQTTGPMAVDTYGEVVKEWSTPLASTTATLAASAQTMLASSVRPSRTRTVTHAPDPRIELDDPVSVTADGVTEWGWVTGYDLPLTVADGDMTTTVAVSA